MNMKQINHTLRMCVVFAVVSVCAVGAAYGEMFHKDYSVSFSGSVTNAQSFVINGEVAAIDIRKTSGANPAAGTNVAINIYSDEEVIFSLTDIADGTNVYYPRISGSGPAGVTVAGTNYVSELTPVSGPVTVQIINTHVGVTNAYATKILYRK